MKKFISAFILSLALCACETTSTGPQVKGDTAAKIRNFITVIEPGFRLSAALLCSTTLALATSGQDQIDMRNDIYTFSSVIASYNGENPQDFTARLIATLPKTNEYQTLAQNVGGLLSIAYPFIKGDPALLAKVVADLAAGCADATKPATP